MEGTKIEQVQTREEVGAPNFGHFSHFDNVIIESRSF